jgi:hypothetical protein
MMMLKRLFALVASIFVGAQASAQQPPLPEKSRDNFMAVVRETMGANRPYDQLTPSGKAKAKLADGREIEFETASWEFIGDTHIRFVFDGPRTMINATPEDLEKLGIRNVDEALALALANLRRVYGEPVAKPWERGLMQVQGRSPDLDSSYFLDRSFWNNLLKKHPEGLVVSVAKRGGLLYAPLCEGNAVEVLQRGVAYLHSSSQRLRVSSSLFLFKAGTWSVFQDPVKQ